MGPYLLYINEYWLKKIVYSIKSNKLRKGIFKKYFQLKCDKIRLIIEEYHKKAY